MSPSICALNCWLFAFIFNFYLLAFHTFCPNSGNRSWGCNARFTVTRRTVSVQMVPQMRGGGHADVLPVLQVPDNKTGVVPCERLQIL
jgi:hypothetical protein